MGGPIKGDPIARRSVIWLTLFSRARCDKGAIRGGRREPPAPDFPRPLLSGRHGPGTAKAFRSGQVLGEPFWRELAGSLQCSGQAGFPALRHRRNAASIRHASMALPRIRGELAAAPMRILTGGNGPKGGVRKRIDAAPITPRGLVREFGLCPVADVLFWPILKL